MSNLFGEEDPYEESEGGAEATPLQDDGADLSLIGHDALMMQFSQWADDGQVPHGLVLHGPRGLGKHLLAYHLAATLLRRDNLQRIIHGGHPDVLSIGREIDERKGVLKADIPVATARKVPVFMRQTPAEGGWRVVVIDDADHMNLNAQNALLKSLEEPPKKTILILVVHQLGRLIPTIRSRVRVQAVAPLHDNDLHRVLSSKLELSCDPLATIMAKGSVGRAQDLSDPELMEEVGEILSLLPRAAGMSAQESWALMQKIGSFQNLHQALRLVISLMEQIILDQANGATGNMVNALPSHLQAGVTGWAAQTPLDVMIKIRDNLEVGIAKAEATHLDRMSLAKQILHAMKGVS